MWAGGYYHYAFSNTQHVFLTKEPNKYNARRISARRAPLQKGSFGCCAVEKHVYKRYVHHYAYQIRYYVVSMRKYNGDKLHHRKSMQAADEKLTIWGLIF